MNFTHSLAEIAPNQHMPYAGALGSGLYSNNLQPQYTSYNGDIYRTIGVVPTFFVQTDSFTNSGLYYDFFGVDNTNLINANQFTDFNYIFDVYQLDQSVPNLQDIVGYRYNQYPMYANMNLDVAIYEGYRAGKKIKNLGRYKVAPHPETGLGSLNISRVLRAHQIQETPSAISPLFGSTGSSVFFEKDMVSKIKNMITNFNNLNLSSLSPYRPDTENTCKWNIEYGFEVNPGLTFSDSYYSIGSYINPGTGQVATYSLGFTFSTPHYLKYGDEIIIQMNDLSLNPQYNGLCYVVDVVNPYHIVVDKMFGQSSVNEAGSIPYLLRANEIQSGNWWKYYASQQNGINLSQFALGYMAGRQTTNLSINGTTQRYLNPVFKNFGQVDVMGNLSYYNEAIDNFYKTAVNDVSQLLINRWMYSNVRAFNSTTASSIEYGNVPRFFMTNWDDETMGRKELNFYYWGPIYDQRFMNFPDYTLGALTHQNFFPAYYRQYATPPTNFGDKLSTVPTFNTLRWTLLDANGNLRGSYDRGLSDLTGNPFVDYIPDYEKFEFVLSSASLWTSLGLPLPDQNDILRVELIKAPTQGWTFSDFTQNVYGDYNVIMDFDGFDYDEPEEPGVIPKRHISPYPFHYQFSDYYDPFCDNEAQFKGPFGSRQSNLTTPYDIKDYNFLIQSQYQQGANWPYTPLSIAPNNRGWWYSEMTFRIQDSSCNDGIAYISMYYFNELNYDYINSETYYSGLQAGTYSMDYIVIQATQSSEDILQLNWQIGNEYVSLPLGAPGTIHQDVEIYTNGGGMMWWCQIDPAPGAITIQPLKIRHKSDIVMAKKEFKCNLICRGENPYTTPLGKWDYGQQVELMFLNRLGSYERLYFDYDSKRTINISRNTYSKSMIRDRWGLFDEKHSRGILSQTATEQYLINSNWIEQNKLTFYEELITSPEVYIVHRIARLPSVSGQAYQTSPVTHFIPVNIQDTSFQNKTYLRDKLFNLQLTIELAFDINLQNQ